VEYKNSDPHTPLCIPERKRARKTQKDRKTDLPEAKKYSFFSNSISAMLFVSFIEQKQPTRKNVSEFFEIRNEFPFSESRRNASMKI